MQTFVTDDNVVGSVDAVIFTAPQQGSVNMAAFLINNGTNTLTYHWQTTSDGMNWTEMGTYPSPLYNVLISGQVVNLQVQSPNTQVRLLAMASGGSVITFGLTRFFPRAQGGALPLMGGL